jgi:hypothetical protein
VCLSRPNEFIRADTHKASARQQQKIKMIHDCTNGVLNQIKAFAKEKHLARQFVSTFSRFKVQSKRVFDTYLYPDFAPLSMYFERKKNNRFDGNGGFIFHGIHDGGGNGGAPTFSVELNPDTRSHWSIHTLK